MLEEQQRIFLTIPRAFEKELEEEVLEFYAIESRKGIPLIENIIRHLTYYIFRFAHHELYGEELAASDTELLDLNKLKDALENEEFRDAYYAFRKNVEYYFQKRGFFYETNWVYADKSEDYLCEYVNSSIQDIW